MLRFLRVLFGLRTKPPLLHLAFWTDRELTDLSPELTRVLEAESLVRDHENEWEWLAGFSRHGFSINVSRTHDWAKGHHDLPVLVALTQESVALPNQELRRWAFALAQQLGFDVSIGYMRHATNGRYDFDAREVVQASAAR